MAAEGSRIVKLASSDAREFLVDFKVAQMSVTLKNMLEDLPEDDTPIPLPTIAGNILERVIRYCEHHKDDAPVEDHADPLKPRVEITGFDAEYIEGVDQATLFDMIIAANFLDIKPLLDLTCKTVADMISGKTPQEIRDTFGIKNDFTPEEEEMVRKENEWAQDPVKT